MGKSRRVFVRRLTSQSEGYALQWEVEAEIAGRYYARIALGPQRYEIKQGDTLYALQNHVCQLFAADATPLRLFNVQTRVFKHLGYNTVRYFEPVSAPRAEQLTSSTSV